MMYEQGKGTLLALGFLPSWRVIGSLAQLG